MMPLDPHETAPADNPSTSGQLPDDENNAADLVEIGRRTAETELRDAVTERYVDEANRSDETDAFLADLALTETAEDEADEIGPETDALHLEVPPED